MHVNLELTITCTLCGNSNDKEFYIMPVEKKVKDGKIFSFVEYKLVCQRCRKEHTLKLNPIIVEGD